MNENRFFADVDLPFHVWIREGDRWVLREAPQAHGDVGQGTDAPRASARPPAAVETRRAA